MQLHQIRPRAIATDGPEPLVDAQSRRIRYLRVSLSDRCNMRCTYCMPAEGIDHVARADLLSLEEIVEVVRSFAAWGVERVRLTGGEPTIRRGLPWLVEALSSIEVGASAGEGPPRYVQVVMTSNAERLGSMAKSLRDAGLHALNISLDTLDKERFKAITRRDVLDKVLAGIDAVSAAGFENTKINTVAIAGFNDDELADLCRFAWSRSMTPRFIELMPMSAGRLFVPGELLPASSIRENVGRALDAQLEEAKQRKSRSLGPARYWALRGGEFDGKEFGLITAMTENFCDSCNRLRISATGRLHACLARDEATNLRGALRANGPAGLEAVVREALGAKLDRHDFQVDGQGGPDKAMISIGG
jgi:cyclic pyranopterin phosphate synthase